jgi:serine/threonine protein kinase
MPAEDEDVVARANARIGVLLKGKYTLDRILGTGGMATVYAATHRNGKQFAVKVLHADLSMRSETRTRFLREGYLANRVNHPGAVAVLDDDIADDGGAFLVMELLHGQTLEALWENNHSRLPLRLVAGVGLQLLDVLAAAHARGLTHRDIKPGNLMLTDDGLVKVLDFGIARLRDVAAVSTTQTGMVMGTPAFMAPEQALAKADEIDAQTDLWATGATLYTLASGQMVHQGVNAQQILVRAATTPARSLAAVMPEAPSALRAVIDRALAFEKSKRWSNAAEMRGALGVASREAFDAVPTPAAMAAVLADLRANEKTAVQPPTEVPDVGTLVSSGQDPGPSPRRVAVAGAITAEAVASDSAPRRSAVRPRGVQAGLIAVAALAIGGLLLIVMRGASSKDSPSVGTAAGASSVSVPSVAVAPPPASASATSTWSPVQLPPETTIPAVPAEALRPAAPLATKRVGVPALPVATNVAPATTASAAKPRCDPPYEFDDKGNKRWKRECL